MLENELLASLRPLFNRNDPSVLTGSGPDDCAHLRADGRNLAVSVDAFAEGSHFTEHDAPEDIARKCMGASLSDLAASGCRARWVAVSLSLRPGLPENWSGRFARALAAAADSHDATIVGGDTIASKNGIAISVTVIGEPLPGGPLLRSGARPGDILAVTGTLGGSILGKHLRPEPRLREIAFLMDACRRNGTAVSAAMDISDGLALDSTRLCKESGVGAVIEAALVPLSPDALALAREDGRSGLDHALSDGEDFELLVALPPPAWKALSRSAYPAQLAPFVRIGMIQAGGEIVVNTENGGAVPLRPQGYQHQW